MPSLIKRAKPNVAVPANPPHDTVRRLQIGIAGVITVLLLVSMAGIASDRARENAGVAATGDAAAQSANASNSNGPLEDLGIQPVAKDAVGAPAVVEAPYPSDARAGSPRTSVPDLEPDPTLERARQNKN
jgi:hypothetical protein